MAALPLHFPIRVKLLLLSFLDRFIPPFRLQFLKDVCVALLFAECYQEIFLSVLAAGIPLLGCVSLFFFLPSNKEDSGVLTFT